MSPHAVNSLVSDLVSMAKAMEELPEVKAHLEDTQHINTELTKIVGFRDQEITSLRTQIADMATKINLAEANRDDAELRFLELEERAIKAARAFKVAIEAMDVADALAEDMTMKPEPMQVEDEAHRQPEALDPDNRDPNNYENRQSTPTDATQGQSATNPTPIASTSTDVSTTGAAPSAAHSENASSGMTTPSEGVSVPTDPSIVNIQMAGTLPSATSSANENVSAPTHGDPLKPYLGKFYRDVPGYVSFTAWINGGGTENDYYIR